MSKTDKMMTAEKRLSNDGANLQSGEAKGSEILNDDILTTLLSLDNYKGVFLAELIDIYTATLPTLCDEIVMALTERKYQDMSRLAHKAKGMSLSLGTKRLVDIFERLETGTTPEVLTKDSNIVEKMQEEYVITSQELRSEWYLRKDFAKRRRDVDKRSKN
jgi:HPt (histidine-containing phosphotransfer) domain-containing protein